MKSFFYIRGKLGLNYSGNFVDNRSKWIKFTEEEKIKGKPKEALKFGAFVEVNKFRYI
jgi:hypothetical protein